MKFLTATLIICMINIGASLTPGQILDKTFNELRKSISNLKNYINQVNGEVQILKTDVKALKVVYGSCAPCYQIQTGSNSDCDCTNLGAKKDCLAFFNAGIKVNGIYTLEATKFSTVRAYCDQTTQGGGWTVIQRRKDGSVSFDRKWNAYKNGFGKLTGEFWFGNENIHDITRNNPKQSQLLITMKMKGARKPVYAKYAGFTVGGEASKYKMSISGYSGTAGNPLSYHSNMMFSTKDNDNDKWGSNCAARYVGGWWYNSCHLVHLNGIFKFPYASSGDRRIRWQGSTQPEFVEMKVRRNK